jgi:3-deoxy-D-manno-octulosonic-acid transferase
VFLVNARLSNRSYRGYRFFSFLFAPLFASFAGIGIANEADRERLLKLGCRPEAIQVVGNLKFDAAKLDERRQLDVPALLRQLGVPPAARLLVGGSTHSGEEALLAEQFLRLRRKFPDLFLVLVPRHFERGKAVGKELTSRGIKFIYRSEIMARTRPKPGAIECLLVNTTGELKYFYEHAAVIFIGKSLSAHGGQNPIEPGALGRAMVFGPNMENFAAIAAAFVSEKGAVQVRNPEELEKTVESLLANEGLREEMGRNAQRVVQKNRGAIDRTVDMILKEIKDEDIYLAPHP